MPRYDLPNAAPEPLRLVQLFVNTVDREHGREWLPTPAALKEWFGARGVRVEGDLGEEDLRRAHDLRESLRALLRANNGALLEQDAVAVLNEAALGVVPRLDAGAVGLQPMREGFDGALGHVTAVALEAMLEGSWRRLKACRQCGWAFYDYSKNRSASWCSMALCGNRLKTRAYRRRRAEAKTGG